METLTIQIPDEKSSMVKQILQEFGVTILTDEVPSKKPSSFAGIISKETAKQLLLDVERSRREWERDI
ncbi:hypothetical protein [Pedobacter endophyticus]|uniref:Uncharacterized protein n=1 Tax=Pedobacter endophyticus TaxID=2789740 RepID=A0A7S9L364_9SPHI|nr:hypothetical protein [Pedobacter endophyticus]QPH41627.1 hypothetical protein IZT61_10390 [Pedobacter endophyticus]